MRVVSGRLGGRRLLQPPAVGAGVAVTRPSSQRTRSALFDALGERVDRARVLDLFAGSGALGIEALSRGARHASFVERARPALRALRGNLRALELSGCSRVFGCDAAAAIARLRRERLQFEVILLDPPYALDRAPDALVELAAPGSCLVAERSRRAPVWDLRGWVSEGSRNHGETRLDWYRLALVPMTGPGAEAGAAAGDPALRALAGSGRAERGAGEDEDGP